MFAFTLFLAEVGDKVPRLPVLFLWSAAIMVFAWALIRWKKWLAILPLFVAVCFAIGATAEPRDPFVGPAIVHELGYGYIAFAYLAAALPFIAIARLLLRRRKNA